MKKHMKPKIMVGLIGLLLLGIIGTTCFTMIKKANQGAETSENMNGYTEGEAEARIREELLNPNVVDVKIEEEHVFCSTIEVVGNKNITGGGTLKAETDLESEGFYILTVSEDADVKLQDIKIDCNNKAGGVHVKKEGTLSLESGSSVYYAEKNLANVLVEGECTLDEGELLSASGNSLINKGKTLIKDGQINGSGIHYSFAGVVNEGKLTMSGGTIEQCRTNVAVKEDGTFTFKAGTISDSLADGIAVEKGGKLVVDSDRARIKGAGLSGIYINGEAEINNVSVMTSDGDQVQIGKDGDVTIHQATITRSFNNGINNSGKLNIENIEVSFVEENGIVNKGTLVLSGGTIHDNDKEGIFNKMGGDATVVSGNVSIYNNHTAVMNYPNSTMELSLAQIYDNSAYSVCNYGVLNLYDITVKNSGSTSVYGRPGGTMNMKNVIVDGTVTNHGVYLTGGTAIEMANVTIKNTAARGISNAGGTLVAKNVTITRAGTDGIGNFADSGSMKIDNLKISGSSEHNIQNAGGNDSPMDVSNATLGVTTSHSIRNNTGILSLTNVVIEGVKQKTADSDVHGIYTTAEKLIIRDCQINNVEHGRGIFNRGTNTEIHGLKCDNIKAGALYNALGKEEYLGNGNITAEGLVVTNPKESSVVQDTPDGIITIKNSNLTSADGFNVIVNNRGTIVLENGVDITSVGRAINNKGTMVINGGRIHDIVPTGSQMASAILNIGELTINDGEICNNVSTLKGVVSNVTGAFDKNQDGIKETLYGTLTINGGKFYNNKVAGGKESLNGGVIYVEKDTKANLLGGYYYNNLAEGLGNDIYNIGNLTLGNIAVGYDATGRAYSVEEMIGELYTENVMAFSGKNFYHSSTKPLNVTLPANELGTSVITVASDMAAALKSGIDVNGLSDEYYLEYNEGTLKIWKEDMKYACKIGNTGFYTLSQAVDFVENNGTATIVVTDDIALDATVVIGDKEGTVKKNITIVTDGTGRTISRSEMLTGRFFTVGKGSSLTLGETTGNDLESDTNKLVFDGMNQDNGTEDARMIYVYATGSLTINPGVILQNNINSGASGVATVLGTTTINGGVIRDNKTTSSHGGAFYVRESGSVIMNGGCITDNYAYNRGGAFYITDSGTVTMTGGVVENNKASHESDKKHAVDIDINKRGKGLVLSGSAYVKDIYLRIKEDTCAVEINGELTTTEVMNIKCATNSENRVVIKAGDYTADSMSKFKLANAGDFGLKLAENNSVILYLMPQDTKPARIGDTEYDSLKAAFEAVPEGGTEPTIITITGDIVINELLEIGDDEGATKNITIQDDGTARTISRGSGLEDRLFRVYAGSTLTLTTTTLNDEKPLLTLDGGSRSAIKKAQFIYSQGTVNINSGVVMQNNANMDGAGAIMVNKGITTVNGGLITNCEVTANNGGAIYVAKNGTLIMKGGTITGNKIASGKNGSGVYVTGGKLQMSGGSIYGNKIGDVESEDVYLKKDTNVGTLTMRGDAYVQNITMSNASQAIQLTGDLTTDNVMTIKCTEETADRVVIESGDYTAGNWTKFTLSSDTYQLALSVNKVVLATK